MEEHKPFHQPVSFRDTYEVDGAACSQRGVSQVTQGTPDEYPCCPIHLTDARECWRSSWGNRWLATAGNPELKLKGNYSSMWFLLFGLLYPWGGHTPRVFVCCLLLLLWVLFVWGLLFWGLLFGCLSLGTTFGLSQHVGGRSSVSPNVWATVGCVLGFFVWDLELPRGMSATTLPGGKCQYGICQNREEAGKYVPFVVSTRKSCSRVDMA